jgi:hypothetical protein
MVKFRLPLTPIGWNRATSYRRGNHVASRRDSTGKGAVRFVKLLIKLDRLKFEENLRHIRIDIAQKRRFIANDSFKPVW